MNAIGSITPHGVLAGSTYKWAVKALGPAAYWRLGEASGTSAVDEMGAQNGLYYKAFVPTAPVHPAGLLVGDANTAAAFVAADTDVMAFSGIDLTATDWTMSAWINPTQVTSRMAVFSAQAGGYEMDVWNGHIGVRCNGVADGAFVGTLSAGVPAMVTITYVLATHSIILYINNWSSGGVWSPSFTAGAKTIWIGSDSIGSSFGGVIDEPAIWTRALSHGQIAMLCAIGQGTW